ncbi:MAG: sulfoxide reductase heme-binding subunit YedZ [Hyphomicrobiaceae bacterium]|jgi:sulfoxide reductase heme-binding subunit YedZ
MPRPLPLPFWPFATYVIVATAALAAWFLGEGLTESGLQMFTRHTARFSFSIFIVAFFASSLAKLAPASFTRALVRNRRCLGLAFALAHFIHLGAIIGYFTFLATVPDAAAIVGGGLGYVFVALLALTSTNAWMNRLGRNWKRLHTVGVYYIWIIFAQTYAGRVSAPDNLSAAAPSDPVVYAVLLAIALIALSLRIVGLRR